MGIRRTTARAKYLGAEADIRKMCRRDNSPGHAHSLTFSCFRGLRLLSKNRTCQWMVQAMEQARAKHHVDLWAYVIMPEHVHLLLCPSSPDYSIGVILTTLKQPVSKRAAAFVRSEHPEWLTRMTDVRPDGNKVIRFWQRGGGYDRNLWSPKHVWEAIDYIHANPVRRGLCDLPTDWPWSSAREYAGEEDVHVNMDFETLPNDPRRHTGG